MYILYISNQAVKYIHSVRKSV